MGWREFLWGGGGGGDIWIWVCGDRVDGSLEWERGGGCGKGAGGGDMDMALECTS